MTPHALQSEYVDLPSTGSHFFRARWFASLVQLLVCATILGAAGYGFYSFLEASDHFRVRTIVIEGAQALDEHDLVSVSGITRDDNLLFLDAQRVASHLEALPRVRHCEVIRLFPDRVAIRIEERTPVAAAQFHNQLFDIDAEGVVLRELKPHELPVGPLFSGIDGRTMVEPGDHLNHDAFQAAMTVWRAFSETRLARDMTVAEIHAADPHTIRMFCDELAFEIRWRRDGIADQAQRLDLLWREKGSALECQEYLDLRWGRDIACR